MDKQAQRTTSFDRIRVLYEAHGDADYIGEPVSIVEHSLQVAYFAHKKSNGVDEEVVIAGLLHDIGHVLGLEIKQKMDMNGCGVTDHEHVGADFLQKLGFPTRVCKLVRSHVQAKRYLCYKHPEYLQNLTEASKTTLGFQGGPMTEIEAADFERDPDFQIMLLMRECDEAGKVPSSQIAVPNLESYQQAIQKMVTMNPLGYTLSQFQIDFFKQNSFLKVENLLSFDNIAPNDVGNWCEEISQWPKVEGKWILHWEINNSGERIMCRSENFVNYHAGMELLAKQCILNVVSQLDNDQEAVLFKEKINYKLVGGSGFSAHQDSPAYIGLANDHISVMVAVDDATEENGCLQVAPGRWSKESNVPLTSTGVITKEAEAKMDFIPVTCRTGDILFFNGYLPHRSNANLSNKNRRAVFLTYNPASQGDHHKSYYEAKHSNAQGFDSSHTISFQGDFQGKIVD
jgi:putative nucleotidyltransferase with HDIG domain